MSPQPPLSSASQRIDQWLWFARIVKSRTLAQELITRGKVRLNRARLEKTSQTVKVGDVVTITLGPRVRVLEVLEMDVRRGPAPQAQKLYRVVSDTAAPTTASPGAPGASGGSSCAADAAAVPPPAVEMRPQGAGRPTKKDRRAIDRLKGLT